MLGNSPKYPIPSLAGHSKAGSGFRAGDRRADAGSWIVTTALRDTVRIEPHTRVMPDPKFMPFPPIIVVPGVNPVPGVNCNGALTEDPVPGPGCAGAEEAALGVAKRNVVFLC